MTQSLLQSHWDLCTSAQIYGYAKYFESHKMTLVYLKLFSEVVLNYSDEDTYYKSQKKKRQLHTEAIYLLIEKYMLTHAMVSGLVS